MLKEDFYLPCTFILSYSEGKKNCFERGIFFGFLCACRGSASLMDFCNINISSAFVKFSTIYTYFVDDILCVLNLSRYLSWELLHSPRASYIRSVNLFLIFYENFSKFDFFTNDKLYRNANNSFCFV